MAQTDLEYKKVLEILTEYMMKNVDSSYVFGNNKKVLDNIIRSVVNEIDSFIKNKSDSNKSSEQLLIDVRNVIHLIKNIVLNGVITTGFSEFVDALLLLLSNWNNSGHKNEELTVDINLISRYKNLHFTTNELLQYSKVLMNRMKELSVFSMPQLDLSKHYLSRFKEHQSQNNDTNIVKSNPVINTDIQLKLNKTILE